MAIRILALCAVLLLPLSVCQAVLQDGGFEYGTGDDDTYWQWRVNRSGYAGMVAQAQLMTTGDISDGYLYANEGYQFGMLSPDGHANSAVPQITSVYQTGCRYYDDTSWISGVYAFHQIYPQTDPDVITSGDYIRISAVEASQWDSYLGTVGGVYDGLMPKSYAAWSVTYTEDTCTGATYSSDWWQPFKSTPLAAGTYTVLFDMYRYGTDASIPYSYSVAGFDSISHTPEPSLGLLLLVGMIPVAIGFRRRRRSS